MFKHMIGINVTYHEIWGFNSSSQPAEILLDLDHLPHRTCVVVTIVSPSRLLCLLHSNRIILLELKSSKLFAACNATNYDLIDFPASGTKNSFFPFVLPDEKPYFSYISSVNLKVFRTICEKKRK